jgi:hypothetical protein
VKGGDAVFIRIYDVNYHFPGQSLLAKNHKNPRHGRGRAGDCGRTRERPAHRVLGAYRRGFSEKAKRHRL